MIKVNNELTDTIASNKYLTITSAGQLYLSIDTAINTYLAIDTATANYVPYNGSIKSTNTGTYGVYTNDLSITSAVSNLNFVGADTANINVSASELRINKDLKLLENDVTDLRNVTSILTVVGNDTGAMANDTTGSSQTGKIVSIPDNSVFEFAADFTINMWVRPVAYPAAWYADAFIGKDNQGSGNKWIWGMTSAGNSLFWHINGSGGAVDVEQACTNIPLNAWSMVTVKRVSNVYHQFLNGVEQGTGISSAVTIQPSGVPMTIGHGEQGSPVYAFPGRIDEVGLWSTALSDGTITSLYNSGAGVYGDTANAPFNANFIAGWHLDEGTGTLATDLSETGIVVNPSGKKYSLQFDGKNGYASTPLISTKTANISLTAWFKSDNYAKDGQTIMYMGSDVNGDGYGIFLNREGVTDGSVYVLYGGLTWIDSTVDITDNNWHFASLVLESDGHLSIYIDGSLATHYSGGVSPNTPTLHFEIGRNDYYGGYERWFKGHVDEITIFDKSLSLAEVTALYNSGAGVYGNVSISPFNSALSGYHCDEGTGTSIADYVGLNTGTLYGNSGFRYDGTSAADWATGKVVNPGGSPATEEVVNIAKSEESAEIGVYGTQTYGESTGYSRIIGKTISLRTGTTPTERLLIEDALITASQPISSVNILPSADKTYDLGGISDQWGQVFIGNGLYFEGGVSGFEPDGSGGLVEYGTIYPSTDRTYDLGMPDNKFTNTYTGNLYFEETLEMIGFEYNWAGGMDFYGNFVPTYDGTYSLGATGQKLLDVWSNAIYFDDTQDGYVTTDGGTGIILGGTLITSEADIIPSADVTYYLGSTSNRWGRTYFEALYDASDNVQIDLTNRTLNDSGGSETLDWENLELVGAWVSTGGTFTTKDGRVVGITNATSSFTLGTNHEYVVGDSSGAFTLALPPATGSGQRYYIKNVGAGLLTIDADASETIDGETTQVLSQYEGIDLQDYASGVWSI